MLLHEPRMLNCMQLHAWDQIKLVFTWCRFNTSWLGRLKVLQTKIFCIVLKWHGLPSNHTVQFIKGCFDHVYTTISTCILLSPHVYYDLHVHTTITKCKLRSSMNVWDYGGSKSRIKLTIFVFFSFTQEQQKMDIF